MICFVYSYDDDLVQFSGKNINFGKVIQILPIWGTC